MFIAIFLVISDRFKLYPNPKPGETAFILRFTCKLVLYVILECNARLMLFHEPMILTSSFIKLALKENYKRFKLVCSEAILWSAFSLCSMYFLNLSFPAYLTYAIWIYVPVSHWNVCVSLKCVCCFQVTAGCCEELMTSHMIRTSWGFSWIPAANAVFQSF